MKRFLKTAVLSLAMLCAFCVSAQAMENDMLKVGLKYGSGALFTARLQNYNDVLSGSGYTFGYYDAERSFVPLVQTDEQKVTVTVDGNAYVSGDVCYETRPTNYSTVLGGYHIELMTAFDSCEEAQAVAAQYEKAFVAYIDGEYRVRIGNHASYDESAGVMAQTDVLDYGAQIVTPSSTGVTVSVTGTDTILFEFDCSGLRSLGILPRSVQGEQTMTWFAGYRYYGGFEYPRTTGGYLNVINVLNIEDYVKCVIAAEMSNDWPLEALKAQTVCARTYAAAQTRHRSSGFDVCSTVDCQAYRGASLSNEYSDAAAEETRGVYIYYDGALVTNAVYYSCNGGASESCKNVWGTEVPYLQGKLDPYEESVAWRFSKYYWSFTATGEELRTILQSEAKVDVGTVKNVYVSQYSDTGNVIALTFEGTKGSYTAQREKCRTLLNGVYDHVNVRSMHYTVTGGDAGTYYINDASTAVTGAGGLYTISGSGEVSANSGAAKDTYIITADGVETLARESANTSDRFTFSGSGWGHNVGMSQWGAFAMAEQGYTYRDILNFYYMGITLS